MGNPYAIPHEQHIKLTANRKRITIGLPTPQPAAIGVSRLHLR